MDSASIKILSRGQMTPKLDILIILFWAPCEVKILVCFKVLSLENTYDTYSVCC